MKDYDRFLLAVVYNIPNFIFVVDPATNTIIYANQHMRSILGESCVGRSFAEQFPGAGADCFFVRQGQEHDGVVSATPNALPEQSEYYDEQGEDWYQVRQSQVQWIDGSTKIVFMLNEINGMKSLQHEISYAYATLAVKNRDLELEKNNAMARSEANATLGTMIAGVSHELKTPIGNCLMTASALEGMARKFATEFESGSLKKSHFTSFISHLTEGTALMLRNMQRAEELLTQFRQVAADQASEQQRVFSLADTVHEIVATLAPSLKCHPHKVVIDISPGIRMDSKPGPLGQVVINLINNAYLHAFENRNDGVLTIRGEADGDWVKLSFADNGVGMSEELLAKLFQPFFSTKIGKGGTGLGMAIVENLVKVTLGGDISVTSKVGKGTSFEIRLPLTLPARN